LYAAGFHSISNTDISTTAISRMQESYPTETHPGMTWQIGDATAMTEFSDGSFDVVLDKAVLDTMLFR